MGQTGGCSTAGNSESFCIHMPVNYKEYNYKSYVLLGLLLVKLDTALQICMLDKILYIWCLFPILKILSLQDKIKHFQVCQLVFMQFSCIFIPKCKFWAEVFLYKGSQAVVPIFTVFCNFHMLVVKMNRIPLHLDDKTITHCCQEALF